MIGPVVAFAIAVATPPSDDPAWLHVERRRVVVGERIAVTFADPAGDPSSWVGLFDAAGEPRARRPTGGATSGRVVFPPPDLTPGRYEARLATEDRVVAQRFTVGSGAAVAAPRPVGDLTVATFNIWVDAKGPGGPAAAARAIADTHADVIGLQECRVRTLRAIVDELRKQPHYREVHASERSFIVSRHPIVHDGHDRRDGPVSSLPRRAGVALIELPGGHRVHVFNVHLSPYPYGPYGARDGHPLDRILADESARLAELHEILFLVDVANGLDEAATIVVGDFNAASHLDWTSSNREQNFGLAIDWPVSRTMEEAGFVDAFRAVHRDPTAVRGYTWSCGYPKGTLDPNDVHDRIDYVHARDGAGLRLSPVSAYTYAPDPYPSDHRMVVVGFGLR